MMETFLVTVSMLLVVALFAVARFWRIDVSKIDYWKRRFEQADRDLDEYREEAMRLRKTLRQIESAMKGGSE